MATNAGPLCHFLPAKDARFGLSVGRKADGDELRYQRQDMPE